MQFSDFFNVGSGLGDAVKIVLFRMLPRGAQIEKVRAEINSGLLKKYGKMTKLEIDKKNKTISADLDMKGEKESIRITISNYRLVQSDGKNLVFEPGTIEVSREWLARHHRAESFWLVAKRRRCAQRIAQNGVGASAG